MDDPNFDAQEIPININEGSALINVNPIDFYYTNELCPSTTGSTVLPVDHELLREELTISKLTEDALDDMLDDIVDGGNTGQVLSDIIHLEDNSAWITYYELMNKSPYLSDTVLKDIAKKEDVLTVTMIRDILVANPQAAKKSDIKKLLKDRDIQLPDYMIEQIEAGENILSAKEYLEIQKAEQRKIFDRSMMSLVNYYYENSDSLVYASDSIISLLSLRHEPKYLLLLSEYHASVDDFTSAKDDLSAILSDFEMKDYERDEISGLISFYDQYANILKVCKGDLLNLDNSSIEILKGYAAIDDMAGQKATAILLANNEAGFLCTVFEPGMIVSPRNAKAGNINGSDEPRFSIYPNPAKEYVYVDYDICERIGDIRLVIVDATGKTVREQEFKHLRDVIILKTGDLIEGTYNCVIYNGSKMEFSAKLVKEK